jgi:hypothetical protein
MTAVGNALAAMGVVAGAGDTPADGVGRAGAAVGSIVGAGVGVAVIPRTPTAGEGDGADTSPVAGLDVALGRDVGVGVDSGVGFGVGAAPPSVDPGWKQRAFPQVSG